MRISPAASLLGLAVFAGGLAGLTLHNGQPAAQNKPLFEGSQIDDATLAIFQRACQNCHSANTQWPWYSRLPPASWMIARDVAEARSHIDFSRWNSYLPEDREEFLTRIGNAARTGLMPPSRYTLLHPEADLSTEERRQIHDWSKRERNRLKTSGGTLSGRLFTAIPVRR